MSELEIAEEVMREHGNSKLRAELQGDAEKLAMWDEVLNALDDACGLLAHRRYEQIHGVLDRARSIK